MKWFAEFWLYFTKSASEPEFYITILQKKFSASLRFYLLLLLILAAIDIGIFRFREVPRIIDSINQETASAISSLPSTFTASYSKSELTFNGVKLPHNIPSSAIAKANGFGETLITLSMEAKPAPKSFFTFTPTELIVQGTTDIPLTTQGFSYKGFLGDQPFSLSKSDLEIKQREFVVRLPQVANIFSVLVWPIWFLGLTLATTLMLLFISFLTNSFSWILGIHMPFIKTFQLGLHAIGIATGLDVLKYALFPDSRISLVVPGYLGIMVLVIWMLRSAKLVHK